MILVNKKEGLKKPLVAQYFCLILDFKIHLFVIFIHNKLNIKDIIQN